MLRYRVLLSFEAFMAALPTREPPAVEEPLA
jgi:hypothetical protein